MRVIEFYSTVDINGTRLAHKLYDDHGDIGSSTSSDNGSAINIVEGHSLEDNDEKDKVAVKKGNKKSSDNQKSAPKLFSLFKKIAKKVDSLGTKTSDTSANGKKGMSTYRKQHVIMLILEYAKLVAEERERVTDTHGQIDSALREKLLEGFERGDDIGHGDVDHTRSKHYSELRNMAHEHDDVPWKRRWQSEYHLHEALLQFQLAAVQYHPSEKSHVVRELLLKDFHHSDEDNFKLSLEREPPERY